MKKFFMICSLLLLMGTLLAGCTPEEKEPDNTESGQSNSPAINYEISDEVEDFGFDFQFVPEGK